MSEASGQTARLRLSCCGVLQGVGARPALQRLASQLGLRGSLRNGLGVLEIDLSGSRPALETFLATFPHTLPAAAQLQQVQSHWSKASGLDGPEGVHPDGVHPDGVRIAASGALALGQSLVAPGLSADRAPCPRCLAELADPTSRRHRYPFISCCDCGPRYSLATALPFCRAHTTLAAFPPCAACAREFSEPGDRRFHAETISCPACGPRLSLRDGTGRPPAGGEEALSEACRLLRAGKILALQGVGGFQLLVDATQSQAVQRLRERKHRPAKPFALLVAEPESLRPLVHLSAAEEDTLRAPAAPIVLLARRVFSGSEGVQQAVAPGSPALGVMLPASGLHHLLARGMDRPLVATSGNRSGEPLCVAPAEAFDRLAGIADAFLVHDLPIARPLDDSLLQLIEGRPALLRRARGYAPESLPWHNPSPTGPLLALGGDLKAAPALLMGERLWLAPHLGDLADAEQHRRWQTAVEEQVRTAAWAVQGLVCDAHPGYLSHQLVGQLATQLQLPAMAVPHHLAHGLAVLAEHGREPPLLVVACDGLGLAANLPRSAVKDGQETLWGGELLLIHGVGAAGVHWQRLAALRPFPLPGGERASREPRRSALGLLAAAGEWALGHPGAARSLEAFSPQERHLLLQAIAGQCKAPLTSSLGRLLDGVASLLGLAQTLSYEGEAALYWQGAAAQGRLGVAPLARQPQAPKQTTAGAWRLPLCPPHSADPCPLPLGRWDWEPLLAALLADGAAGGSPLLAATRVEEALVEGLVEGASAAASFSGCQQVALAGGCFQNRALLDGCVKGLRQKGLQPLWGERVPCNDGGLALGQLWAAQGHGLGRCQSLGL